MTVFVAASRETKRWIRELGKFVYSKFEICGIFDFFKTEKKLSVSLSDGNEVFFKIKRSTQLKKLMNAYYDRQSMDFNSIAFLFNGRRLRGEQTPNEDGDEIDAMLHQTSGTSA
ncbi:hypothetical protein E1A91_D01G049700v1 [Gossypium mustelinum]|uniref:Rad60/SUMO-like domain-containing protein n=2 Tax=Gossypium TaxID=3633 RepID=A0A5J5SJU7_GOSBA|nr:hypothetical protein ES319_D01G046200v1 [Gossypium barbadense]TYI96142.1 hypothetical protein E1A91_D01G049700v1 [Gossypium mustelinum]